MFIYIHIICRARGRAPRPGGRGDGKAPPARSAGGSPGEGHQLISK